MVDDNLLLQWAEAVAAAELGIRIQVVGGLTLAQAMQLPALGIRDIVISMNLGGRPVGGMKYDQLTAFTVDLNDSADRAAVQEQIRSLIERVSGAKGADSSAATAPS